MRRPREGMRARHGLDRPLAGALRGVAGLGGARRIRLLAGLQRRGRAAAAAAHSRHAAAHRHGNFAGVAAGRSAGHLERGPTRRVGRSHYESRASILLSVPDILLADRAACDCRGDRLASGRGNALTGAGSLDGPGAIPRPLAPSGYSGGCAGDGDAAGAGPPHTGECGRRHGRAIRARRARARHSATALAVPAYSARRRSIRWSACSASRWARC